MLNRRRLYIPAAVALWGASIAAAAVDPEVHRTITAAAVTVTVVAYINRRASDRDVLLRVGLWTGAATERRRRCALMHDHDADRGASTNAVTDPVYWTTAGCGERTVG